MKHVYPIMVSAVAIVILSFSTAFAQVPRTISFQGLLTDGAGTLIADGNHSLVLKLYPAATGGAAIYTETQDAAVAKGTFNVIIGSVTPLPASLAFDRAYYLGVAVDGGAELTPRTPLTAVPYALRAAVAGRAMSLDSSATGAITRLQSSDSSIQITNANGPTTTVNIAPLGVTTVKIAAAAVTAAKISSGTAGSGQVLTADGSGGVSWASASGGGGGLTLPYAVAQSNTADLFSITNSGVARAGYFRNVSTIADRSALYGEMNNSSPTTLAAGVEGNSIHGFGVIGRGGYASSGIFGLNMTGQVGSVFYPGTGVSGFSDWGHGMAGVTYHAGSSGVYGEAFTSNSVGVMAKYNGPGAGVALEVTNGAIKVSGTNRTAFIHTATSGNKIGANATEIDNTMCNGDASAILIVTQNLGDSTSSHSNNSPISVFYDSTRGKWRIVNEVTSLDPTGTRFNVLVIKQ